MKYTQRYNIFALVLLASKTANASSSELRSTLRTHSAQRELNFQEWTGRVVDSVTDALGFGDDDDGESNSIIDSVTDALGFGDDESEGASSGALCFVAEQIIGMGGAFGTSANCTCEGDWSSGVELDCNFDTCAPGSSEVCGKVDLEITFGGQDGPVNMLACADFENDEYKKTCFSYALETNGGFQGTCEATYGGQPCECSVENGICVSADCSRFVPGASIDTCQSFAMGDEGDMQSFFPDFAIFQDDFELNAENVPWAELDFENLDFNNFNIGDVQWGDAFSNETWMGLIGDNPTFRNSEGLLSSGVCKIMAQAASLSVEVMEEMCVCEYNEEKGTMGLFCDSKEVCSGDHCGTVSMDFTFSGLTQIAADVCVDYTNFPTTCYSYPIRLDGLVIPECSAHYAVEENDCTCTITEGNCFTVDCSRFEPKAITDECHSIDLNNPLEDPAQAILAFEKPGLFDSVNDGVGGTFRANKSSGNTVRTSVAAMGVTALAMGLLA